MARSCMLSQHLRRGNERSSPIPLPLHYNATMPLPIAGKVVDVQRQTTAGFARGQLLMEGDRGSRLKIAFQNELLVAFKEGPEEAAEGQVEEGAEDAAARAVLAAVPDLICCVEVDSECCWMSRGCMHANRCVLGMWLCPL